MRTIITALAVLAVCANSSLLAVAPDVPRALIVVGPSGHPPGTHEVAAGARLMEYCLEHLENQQDFEADVVHDWPGDRKKLDSYDTVILIGDGFPGERMEQSDIIMRDLARMMGEGCGMVTIHYGVGLKNEDMGPDGDHPLLHWTGGYFAAKCDHHQSTARIYDNAEIVPADPDHPVSSGVKPFSLHDEPYINNYFGPGNQLLPGAFVVATSMLPPESPAREIIAWGIERPDSGRGLGITLPHFFRNWEIEPLRKFILNGIAWSAKVDIPGDGLVTRLPALEVFGPESVQPVPRKK